MKIYCKSEINIRHHYWINEEYKKNESDLSNLRSIAINADGVVSSDDRFDFIQIASSEIRKLFSPCSTSLYSCYLICKQTVSDKNSRVQNHKKLWKYIAKDWDLDKYILGAEVRMEINNDVSYYGIAKTNIDNTEELLKMLLLRPSRFAVFISCRDIDLSEEITKSIVGQVFVPDHKSLDISYYNACIYLCAKGDIVTRLGDGSCDLEIDLIYNTDYIEL